MKSFNAYYRRIHICVHSSAPTKRQKKNCNHHHRGIKWMLFQLGENFLLYAIETESQRWGHAQMLPWRWYNRNRQAWAQEREFYYAYLLLERQTPFALSYIFFIAWILSRWKTKRNMNDINSLFAFFRSTLDSSVCLCCCIVCNMIKIVLIRFYGYLFHMRIHFSRSIYSQTDEEIKSEKTQIRSKSSVDGSWSGVFWPKHSCWSVITYPAFALLFQFRHAHVATHSERYDEAQHGHYRYRVPCAQPEQFGANIFVDLSQWWPFHFIVRWRIHVTVDIVVAMPRLTEMIELLDAETEWEK